MLGFLNRIPFRESAVAITLCAVLFAGLLTARIGISRTWNNKGYLERAHKREVAELRAQHRDEEASVLRREKTIDEQERRIAERKTNKETVSPEAYVPVWLYKGLQVNVVIAGLLLLASPWIGRRPDPNTSFAPAAARPPLRGWQIAACAMLMGLAAWHNAPRLFHSMWGDEEFNASRFILYYAERDASGALHIQERPWITTLWNMRKPTNHLGYSLFARLTHDAFFQRKDGPTDPWFSEALLRAPVYLAGLLLIPAFFWALRVWGLRAWWGLLLLLLHPWFTRFGVDGRGYGFVMLVGTVMVGVLGRAVQTGRWRWWLSFGLLGFVLIWSNLQGLYPLVALNLTALACLARTDLTWEARRLLATRWITVGFMTLMLIVGYLAPCLPQMQDFMARGEILGTLDARFWADSMSAWLFGQPYIPWDEPDNPLRYAMQLTMARFGTLIPMAAILLLIALLCLGIVALLRRRDQRSLLVFTLGAPAVMLLHMTVSHNRPYDWYFTNFIPGLFLMAAAGAERFRELVPRRAVTVPLLGSIVILYGIATLLPRTLLREHPIEASRESVALTRSVTNARHPDIDKGVITAALAMYTEGYDPALRRCDTREEVLALMDEADRTGKKLYFNIGYYRWLRVDSGYKPICEIIGDPRIFDHIATLPGLLHSTTRDVFLYRGKSP